MEAKITKIPARPVFERPKNVAAYARVSTGKDEMLHSLGTQVSYYSRMIREHPGWRFAGVYADTARTGTKDSRPEFQRLLTDCRAGLIDLVVTKSVSRFARNTVTTLATVRELKALGVDVFFEEQNIHSMSGDGELMLTILSGFAQEESRSASDNQKWRIRKGFENGELMCLRVLYGYCISKEKGVEIDPDQAAVVREMFARAIRGDSLTSIMRWLNHTDYHGVYGGKWTAGQVREVLSNEKYTGNALLQKVFRNNHIDKRLTTNRGQLPQYYAKGTHPAIIDQATYDAAQKALRSIAGKRPNPPKTRTHHALTGMIICQGCGKTYQHVKNHGLSRWACPTYTNEGKSSCPCRKIPEDVIIHMACEETGMAVFDESIFRDRVDHMTAIYPDTLVFHMKDGREITRTWTNRSRAESWTPEMRQRARENELRRRA